MTCAMCRANPGQLYEVGRVLRWQIVLDESCREWWAARHMAPRLITPDSEPSVRAASSEAGRERAAHATGGSEPSAVVNEWSAAVVLAEATG